MSLPKKVALTDLHWVGIDVSKASFDAALVFNGQKWNENQLSQVPWACFPRTQQGAAALVVWIQGVLEHSQMPGGVRVVMEATGRYSLELAQWLLALRGDFKPAIAPPRQTSAFIASLGLRNKTDKVDAVALAFYGMERCPVPYEVPTKQQGELRELTRYRQFLVEQRVACQNRASEGSASAMVVRMQKKHIAQLVRDIAKVEQKIREHIERYPELKRDVDLCSSIYGVGTLIGAVIRAELGDLRRFPRAKQLSAYAGLNPSQFQSGSSVHKRTRMNKNGNSIIRHYLYLAACTAIRGKNYLRKEYLRMRENGKSAMSALGMVMRKILLLMRAILISGKPFDPLWKTGKCNPQGVS
jgi:transposase